MKKQTQLNISADHPAFAGHFPGTPIVPGVVLLDEILHVITAGTGLKETALQVSSVKFLSPLKPNETVEIEYEQLANGSIKFQVVEANRQIVVGNLVTIQPTQQT
ncbi:MAG: hypothetical protein V4605_10045 [Pseudomonadota bacterium]